MASPMMKVGNVLDCYIRYYLPFVGSGIWTCGPPSSAHLKSFIYIKIRIMKASEIQCTGLVFEVVFRQFQSRSEDGCILTNVPDRCCEKYE